MDEVEQTGRRNSGWKITTGKNARYRENGTSTSTAIYTLIICLLLVLEMLTLLFSPNIFPNDSVLRANQQIVHTTFPFGFNVTLHECKPERKLSPEVEAQVCITQHSNNPVVLLKEGSRAVYTFSGRGLNTEGFLMVSGDIRSLLQQSLEIESTTTIPDAVTATTLVSEP